MQLAQLAVRAAAAVVVHAVCRVGILLNFANENPRADCVDRTGLNEEHVALLHVGLVEHIRQRVVFNALFEFLFRQRTVHAEVQRSARLAVHNVPHLGLAVFALHAQRIFVARVHLHGKRLLRIDELDKHRELLKLRTVHTERLRTDFFQILAEFQPVVFTAVYHALARRVRRKLPALRNLFIVALFAVNVAQLCAAPQIVLKCRG